MIKNFLYHKQSKKSFIFFKQNFFFLLRIFTTIQKKHLKATIRIQLHKSTIKTIVVKTHTHRHTHTHTHTQTHTQTKKNNNNKKGNTNFPSQRISTPKTPQTEAPMAAVKEQDPSTAVAKTSNPEVGGILDPLHSYVSTT